MTIEEVRKVLIEVIKNLDTYSDRELVEIKEMAISFNLSVMYEEFCREKRNTE